MSAPTSAPVPAIDTVAMQSAVQELADNAHLYGDIIDALAARNKNPRDVMALVRLLAVGKQAVSVAQDISPAIQQVGSALKAGVETSEFKMANTFSKVAMLVAILAPLIDGVVSQLQHTSFGSSMWLTALSLVAHSFTTVNYTNSRTKVKEAQAAALANPTTEI